MYYYLFCGLRINLSAVMVQFLLSKALPSLRP